MLSATHGWLVWKQWIKDYLPELQKRQKWTKKRRNFVPGDIVLIINNTDSWIMGQVTSSKFGRRPAHPADPSQSWSCCVRPKMHRNTLSSPFHYTYTLKIELNYYTSGLFTHELLHIQTTKVRRFENGCWCRVDHCYIVTIVIVIFVSVNVDSAFTKTTLIWPGLCEWNTPKVGEYQHYSSSPSDGAAMAWSFSNIFPMKATYCCCISVLQFKLCWSDAKHLTACSRLLGKCRLGCRNGSRATQLWD